jgi:hypothetical protein
MAVDGDVQTRHVIKKLGYLVGRGAHPISEGLVGYPIENDAPPRTDLPEPPNRRNRQPQGFNSRVNCRFAKRFRLRLGRFVEL